MRKRISLIVLLVLVVAYMATAIYSSQAASSLVSIEPDIGVPTTYTNARGSFEFFDWSSAGTAGQEYTVRIQTSSKPRMVIGTSDIQNWSYDSGTGIVTINTKSISIHKKDSEGNWTYYPSYVGVAVGTPAHGEGPPLEEAQGTWIATNANSWEMTANRSESEYGGRRPSSITIKVEGKTGVKNGFFKIFRPDALMEKEGLTAETLGAFIDGNAAESTTKKVEGGVLLTLRLDYSVHYISTGEALSISLQSSKNRIKKGKKVKLYGWVSPKKKGVKISLYEKIKGSSGYKKVATAKSNSKGYFKFYRVMKKTAFYKVMKGKKASSVKKVTVK